MVKAFDRATRQWRLGTQVVIFHGLLYEFCMDGYIADGWKIQPLIFTEGYMTHLVH